MNVEREIYELLRQKVHNERLISEDTCEGIRAYALSSGLDKKLAALPDSTANTILQTFMKPVMDMPEDKVIEYFRTYPVISEFHILSNRIFDAAKDKKNGRCAEWSDLQALEKELALFMQAILKDRALKQTLDHELSDCLMDLDFAMGKTNKLSLRLGKTIRKEA